MPFRCTTCGARYHKRAARCPLDGAPLEEEADPMLGALVDGRYLILERIGRGAHTTVYRGLHQEAERPVAVKVLQSQRRGMELVRERFLREARAANRVSHPAVIDITDVGVDEAGRAWLVTELLEGRTLRERLEEGPLDEPEALRVAHVVASALAAAHALGVVHRDLKPENIFLTGEAREVRVLDFGLARIRGERALTETGAMVGTPAYMAPEQVRGVGVGPPADLYSLGCVLFETLTGRAPFEGSVPEVLAAHEDAPPPTLASMGVQIGEGLEALLGELAKKEPGERPTAPACARRLIELGAPAAVTGARTSRPPTATESALSAHGQRLALLRRLFEGGRERLPAEGIEEALTAIEQELSRLRELEAERASLDASLTARLDALEHALRLDPVVDRLLR